MTIPRVLLAVTTVGMLTGLIACSSTCPHMDKLEPMLGKHRFEGYRALGRKTEIRGTITFQFRPDRSALLMHFAQSWPKEEHGFGEIRWDADAVEYALTWEASGRPGDPVQATGFFHADGRLVFAGDMPTPRPAGGSARPPVRFIYTYTFPESGRLVLTIRHPGRKPDTVFESFRITADREDSAPSADDFQKQWNKGRNQARAGTG